MKREIKGLKRLAGETKRLDGYDKSYYMEIMYDRTTHETDCEEFIGYGGSLIPENSDVIICGFTHRPMSMVELRTMIEKAAVERNIDDLINLYESSDKPSDTVKAFLKERGYDDAKETIAAAINFKSYDGRISQSNTAWARSVTDVGTGNSYIPELDLIHPAHLNQLADTMRTVPEPSAMEKEQPYENEPKIIL